MILNEYIYYIYFFKYIYIIIYILLHIIDILYVTLYMHILIYNNLHISKSFPTVSNIYTRTAEVVNSSQTHVLSLSGQGTFSCAHKVKASGWRYATRKPNSICSNADECCIILHVVSTGSVQVSVLAKPERQAFEGCTFRFPGSHVLSIS